MDSTSEAAAARQRGWSVATDGTYESALDEETKRHLLDSMPSHEGDDDNTNYKKPSSAAEKRQHRKRSSSDMSDDSSAGEEEGKATKTRKKRITSSSKGDTKQSRIQQVAQSRLSKWAARLFDPDRPRGLVESPQVIPLNDEFLQAFGQREKAFDKAKGLDLEIDREIRDGDDEDSLYGDTAATALDKGGDDPTADTTNKEGGVKVKMFNLKYTTSRTDLMEACSAFGAVTRLDLLMEDGQLGDAAPRNIGRAYVVFDTQEGAQACVEGLTELDGRSLRLELAASSGSGSSNRGRPSVGNSASKRYYTKDISTKCYRCGEVGHRETDCTNPARAKPCPICAGIDHELRTCPIKAICFNCGIPGHVARECNLARGLPPPAICTVCFQKGHTKMECRQSYRDAAAVSKKAVCMVCGEEGHYLCQQLKWFFGVQGVSCGNCGQSGHIGQECRRPNMEVLSRDDELAKLEVERVVQEEEHAGRRRQRDPQQQQRRRVQSVPPRLGQHRNGSQYVPRDPRGRR